MQKVFIAILPCGILPALDQRISWVSESGFFENRICFRCQEDDYPESMLENIPKFLPMCTHQSFFQALCTRFVESYLVDIVHTMYARYVFVFDVGV